ncbi:G-protein coupled receptor GRL101 [Nymphon striatum]|nr:G-protein coupled receptor GRL101 [Nymphon striatum]
MASSNARYDNVDNVSDTLSSSSEISEDEIDLSSCEDYCEEIGGWGKCVEPYKFQPLKSVSEDRPSDTQIEDIYAQIDLIKPMSITAVVLQDVVLHGKNVYVSKFTLGLSNDSSVWKLEEQPIGQQKVYECIQCKLRKEASISFANMAVRYELLRTIEARFVRINILNYEGSPCLRMEIIGCRDQTECKFVHKEDSGLIKTPDFPNYYGQDKSCIWIIQPKTGWNIWFEFNVLDLAIPEDPNQSGECEDTVTVYHGSSRNTSLTSSLSNNLFSKLIISNGKLILHLKSCFRSSLTTSQGFIGKYFLTECSGCGSGDDDLYMCTTSCGYLYNYGYPISYQSNSRDRWYIKVPASHYIKLTFIEFDVGDIDCDLGYLEVYDGEFSVENYVDRYSACNKPPHQLLSSFDELLLQFSARSESKGRGFLIKYTSMKFELSSSLKHALTQDSEACLPNWIHYNEHCYGLFQRNEALKWYDAEANCNEKHQFSHLLSILDKNEMDVIQYLLTTVWNVSVENIYIGLTDEAKEGIYRWSDGNPMSYADWSVDKSQPDGGQFEDCSVLHLDSFHSTDHWYDIPCSLVKQEFNVTSRAKEILPTVRSYICKFPSNFSGNQMELEKDHLNIKELQARNNHLEDRNSSLKKNSSYFTCSDGVFISIYFACDSIKDCQDGSDESFCDNSTLAGRSFFLCDNQQRISISLMCDFTHDCDDGSDERFCVHPTCDNIQFKCKNKNCIPSYKKCDLIDDCQDNSDELNCSGQCFKNNTFQCNYGTCIPKYAFHDGYRDCPGMYGEDEPFELPKGADDIFPGSCDDIGAQETSLSDFLERSYNFIQPITQSYHTHGVPMPFIAECLKLNSSINGGIGASIEKMPDEPQDLLYLNGCSTILHHDSEQKLYVSKSSDELVRSYKRDIVYDSANLAQIQALLEYSAHCHQTLQWEGIQGVISPSNNSASKIGFFLGSGYYWFNKFIPINRHIYKLVSYCFLQTGKQNIVGPNVEESFLSKCDSQKSNIVCQNGHIVPVNVKCLFSFDKYGYQTGCRDVTHLRYCENFTCPSIYMKCPNSYCIPMEYVCDGKVDCPGGSDEQMCYNFTCPGFYKCRNDTNCISTNQLCDGIRQCSQGDDELLCGKDLSYNSLSIISSGTFSGLSNLLKLDMRYNSITELKKNAFQHLNNLKTLFLNGNPKLKVITAGTFLGLGKITALYGFECGGEGIVHWSVISKDTLKRRINCGEREEEKFQQFNEVRDRVVWKFQNVKEMTNLKGSRIKELKSGAFKGLTSVSRLSSDSFQFCCLASEKIPFSHCTPPADEISSCEDLMSNFIQRVFLWILGSIAFVGNLFVIIWRIRTKDVNQISTSLIISLGGSDFLMGLRHLFMDCCFHPATQLCHKPGSVHIVVIPVQNKHPEMDHGHQTRIQNGNICGLVRSYKPPPGYCTLLHYLRNNKKNSDRDDIVTMTDVLQVAIEICRMLKELHCTGYALGGLDMDMVFILENAGKPLKVYLPDINAYKTNTSVASEPDDDTSKDIEDFGNLVRKMLRVYHLHWK